MPLAFVAVIGLALTVSMSGPGKLGHVEPGWSVLEQCTPEAPGDTRGSVGSAGLTAGRTATSRYVADNPVTLTHPVSGVFRGRVSGANEQGLGSVVSVAGGLGFLVANRTIPPIWAQDANDAHFATFGSDVGQVANPNDIVVDPVDGSVFVASYGNITVGLLDIERYRIIKFDADGNYVTEFGSFGTGDGQFGGPLTVAVSPADQAVWVGDTSNSRIQKFTRTNATTYTYAAKVGTSGTGNGQFGAGGGIPVAVDSAGNVYAGDRGNSRIQKFNSSAVYQAQAAIVTGTASPYDVKVSGSLVYATDGLVGGEPEREGHISVFNTALTAQPGLTIPAPPGTTTGIGFIDVDSGGNIWATWFGATYIVKYDPAGVELLRWQSLFPTPSDLNDTIATAVSADDIGYVLFRFIGNRLGLGPYGSNYVTGFDLRPVPLSEAIESYIEACDPLLNGYTYDYQATTDPDVAFPGWTGDVWTKLKELCTAYNIEVALVDDVIVVRDIGARELTVSNRTPVRLMPSSEPRGRNVQIVAQQPTMGGGVMWDSATEGQTYSIDAGKRVTVVLATDNAPAQLAVPVPTDTLPIQPGQYYVVDSTGTHVPVAAWRAAGAELTAEVGDSPGTISLKITGPLAEISGYTGPYRFATGTSSTATGALSIVGNGVITSREIVTIPTGANPAATATEIAYTIDSPFIDTKPRAYDRGVWAAADAAGPNVDIQFDTPVADVLGYGLTTGAMITHEGSRYRVTETRWGNLSVNVTATRRVTLGEADVAWAGETAGDYDAFWAGYTAGDQRIQPLLTER